MLGSAVKNYSKYYYKHPLTRPVRKHAPIETQRVYPVLSADQLLRQRGRRRVVDEVRITCGVPIEYFNALYRDLIDNFAEFVQHLPVATNFRLTRLDKQLHLASLALSLREPYLLAGELLNRTTDREKALWNYVMFSGILLARLGQLTTSYHVSICDEKGVFIQNWMPFQGPMKGQGSYYKIRDIQPRNSPVESQLNMALARQIMPVEGYNWIASHPEAFEQWLYALDSSGETGAESLVASYFIVLESWLSKEHKLEEELAGDIFEEYLEKLLDDLLMEEEHHEDLREEEQPLIPEETLIGEKFYQWMRDGIAAKKLTVNQANSAIFTTKQGVLLLHPEIFERFVKEHPNTAGPKEVFDQFSKIGLVANTNLEQYVSKFPGLREQDVKGVLLKDASLLFGKNEPPPLTPYMLKANVVKRAHEMGISQRQSFEQHSKEAKAKAHEADVKLKEKAEAQLPKLNKSEEAYKNFTPSNRPPTKR